MSDARTWLTWQFYRLRDWQMKLILLMWFQSLLLGKREKFVC